MFCLLICSLFASAHAACCAPARARNPGTGKTTVARHVGAALRQLGVLRSDTFVERSGAAVLSDSVAEFKKLFEDERLLKKGGLLFLDEAPQLSPKTDRTGAQIVNLLLKARKCDTL